MAFAQMRIKQPAGADFSVDMSQIGVARNDLWLGHPVELICEQPSPAAGVLWSLLAFPAGSAATIANASTELATFTPDVTGTYRIMLEADGVDPQILVVRVRFQADGTLANRGWAYPAVGEKEGESNYDGNMRAWAEPLEFIFEDIRTNGLKGVDVRHALQPVGAFTTNVVFKGSEFSVDSVSEAGQTSISFVPSWQVGVGNKSTRLGLQSEVSLADEGATAYGHLAKARAQNATALGTKSDASGTESVVVGFAKATGLRGVAVGRLASATAARATALGAVASAGGDNSVAVGSAVVDGGAIRSVAIGNSASVSGADSISIGPSSKSQGGYSVAIGRAAEARTAHAIAVGRNSVAEGSNTLAIGYGAEAKGLYCVQIHAGVNTTARTMNVGSPSIPMDCFAQSWQAYSDESLKKDVEDLKNGLSIVLALKPVSYVWKNTPEGVEEKTRWGFVAQSVQESLREEVEGNYSLVSEQHQGESTILALDYMQLIAPIVASIQDIDRRLKALEERKAKRK